MFFYQQKSIDIDRIEPLIHILEELDRKQRKIRSLRGFFRYVLEIMENGQDYQILKTNLQPSFWRKLKTILRQNKKIVLLQFLFGSQDSIAEPETQNHVNEKIEALQNQVNSLQDRIRDLETTRDNSKYALSRTRMDEKTPFTSQQGNSTLEVKKGPYLPENDSEVRNPTYQRKGMESKSISDPPKIDFQQLSKSEEYNLSLNQEKALNEPNFITLGKISEEEKIEIIKLGFQLNQEGKISLKKYYEGTGESSLFQLKGYSIKYEAIRKNKFYQSLKA